MINSVVQSVVKSVVSGAVLGGGGGGPQLPSGAIGYWRATDYTAGQRAYIPSAANPGLPPLSLLGPTRRLFSNAEIWANFGAVIADDAAVGSSGATEASTVLGAGNWRIQSPFSHTFPAGTYTISATVMRNTGTDQPFAFTLDGTTTRSATKTATSAFTRQSYTFTQGSAWPASFAAICSSDGVAGANIILDNLTLHAGSSDLGIDPTGLNIVIGGSAYDTRLPAMSGGEIDLTTGGYGYIQMTAPVVMSECTTIALIKIETAGSFHSWLSKIQQWQNFSGHIDSLKLPYLSLGGADTYDLPGMFTLADCGYHTLIHRGSATERTLWLDGIKLFTKTSGMSAATIRDMWFGVLAIPAFSMDGYWRSMALWDRALSDDECAQAIDVLLTQAGIAPETSRLYFSEGDSISSRQNGYNYIYPAEASPVCTGRTFAEGGATIATMTARAAVMDAIIAERMPGQQVVLSVLIGANDLIDYPGGNAAWLTAYASYLDARYAAAITPGLLPLKIVIGTIPPNNRVGFNALRNGVNPTLRTWVGTHCDAVFDLAASLTVGQDGDELDITKYPDGVHPSDATMVVFKDIIKPVINGL